jgi:hypothetical protein
MPSRKRRPPATRRSALELLAASPDGCTEAILIGLAPAGTERIHGVPTGAAAAFMIRPTTAPSESTSKSSSLHSPDGREADARLRTRPAGAREDPGALIGPGSLSPDGWIYGELGGTPPGANTTPGRPQWFLPTRDPAGCKKSPAEAGQRCVMQNSGREGPHPAEVYLESRLDVLSTRPPTHGAVF